MNTTVFQLKLKEPSRGIYLVILSFMGTFVLRVHRPLEKEGTLAARMIGRPASPRRVRNRIAPASRWMACEHASLLMMFQGGVQPQGNTRLGINVIFTRAARFPSPPCLSASWAHCICPPHPALLFRGQTARNRAVSQ